jgi:hypothetical protein
VSSCGVDVAVRVGVAVSGAVGMGVRRLAVPLGSCATAASTVVVAEGAATTVTCPVDGITRLSVTAADAATPPVAVASPMAVGDPFCGPRPAALVSQLTMVGEAVGETSPCGVVLGPTNTLAPVVAWRTDDGGGGVGVPCATVWRTTSGRGA